MLDSRVCGRSTAGLGGPFAGLRASLSPLWRLALLDVAAIAADRRDRVARLWVVPEPETVARASHTRDVWCRPSSEARSLRDSGRAS
jgi:hypothetical protein